MTELEARAELLKEKIARIDKAYGVSLPWLPFFCSLFLVCLLEYASQKLGWFSNYDATMDAQLLSHIKTIPSTEKKMYMVSCVKEHPSITFKKCMDDWYTNEQGRIKK